MAEKLLTTREVANLLGYRPDTVALWRVKGIGPRFLKLGARSVRYRQDAIDAFLAEQGEFQNAAQARKARAAVP